METRRYKVGLNIAKFYRNAMLACLITFIVGVGAATSVVYSVFSDTLSKTEKKYERQIRDMESAQKKEVQRLIQEHETELYTLNRKFEDTMKRNEELDVLYEFLKTESGDEFEVLRKYWYVLRDGPNDGTINVSVLKYADAQCERWNINPDWLWHIYMVESRWNIFAVNSKSNASGLGQVLPSTGSSYWTKVLNHDTYFDRNMLFDPYVNIEITAAHLGMDIQNGSSFYDAVNHYSGGGGEAYWNKVIAAAKEHGIELSANNWQYY